VEVKINVREVILKAKVAPSLEMLVVVNVKYVLPYNNLMYVFASK
jgi:hypothetical protein